MCVSHSACPTLCEPKDCSPPGSSVHGILQAKILEWVAIFFSRGSSWPRDWTQVFHIAVRFFTIWASREALKCIDITRWSVLKSDWLYSLQPKMEKLSTSAKTRLGADCGSDHELLIAKFRLKFHYLKKVGKTTRPFRYDLDQIPYDYTVEVTNRFKGLDLIDNLKNYGQRFVTLYRRQWSRPSPRKTNAKRQNGCLRRP